MPDGYGFTKSAAERISAAIKKVESQPVDLVGGMASIHPTRNYFWAKITGRNGALYSWLRQIPSNGQLIDDPDAISGTENALELNGSQAIANDTKVQMFWVGYDGSGNPRFLFTVASGGLEVSGCGGAPTAVRQIAFQLPVSIADGIATVSRGLAAGSNISLSTTDCVTTISATVPAPPDPPECTLGSITYVSNIDSVIVSVSGTTLTVQIDFTTTTTDLCTGASSTNSGSVSGSTTGTNCPT